MGEIVPCPLRVKGKFQHLHARQPCRIPQGVYLWRQLPQILGNKAEIREPAGENPQKIHPRPLHPPAIPGRSRSIGNGPIPLKAPEMIQPQKVVQPPGAVRPADPPAEAICFHGVPVIKGIAPQLPVGGKIIRRHTGHLCRRQLRVQLEIFRLRPHIGGVHGHINRQIADNPNPLLRGIGPERIPLPEKQKLKIGKQRHIL